MAYIVFAIMILLTLIALGMLLAEAHRIDKSYAPSKNGVKDDSPSLFFGAILVYLIVLC